MCTGVQYTRHNGLLRRQSAQGAQQGKTLAHRRTSALYNHDSVLSLRFSLIGTFNGWRVRFSAVILLASFTVEVPQQGRHGFLIEFYQITTWVAPGLMNQRHLLAIFVRIPSLSHMFWNGRKKKIFKYQVLSIKHDQLTVGTVNPVKFYNDRVCLSAATFTWICHAKIFALKKLLSLSFKPQGLENHQFRWFFTLLLPFLITGNALLYPSISSIMARILEVLPVGWNGMKGHWWQFVSCSIPHWQWSYADSRL